MKQFNRRKFLKGLGASSLATTLPGVTLAGVGNNNLSDNILIFVFLRGGMDGLSFLTPMNNHPDRGNYEALRTNGTMIPSNQLLSVGGSFGLHPAAGPLRDLYQQNDLAIIKACGLPPYKVNRSHFEAERFAELGTPGDRFTTTGWLTRHLQSATNYPASITLPAVVIGNTLSRSFRGESTAISLAFPSGFDLKTTSNDGFLNDQKQLLSGIYTADNNEINVAGAQSLVAMDIINQVDFSAPASNGAQYSKRFNDATRLTTFGGRMQMLAQLIKQETGMRLGQVDLGGWDTHVNQGNLNNDGTGFYERVRDISESFKAFFTDLDVAAPGGGTWADRTTMIVYSEFGRRAFDNSDAGTDHGWGNTSLVIGGGVNGGRQYGQWPGLAPSDLFQGADLRGTVDYRNVWSEVLLKRLHNNQIHKIFPGFPEAEYNPLGIVSGSAISPDFNDPEVVFRDSYE